MKKMFSAILLLALLACISSTVFAAELLAVKPVIVGDTVSIEISADSAMTYTCYNVPGQARGVVDITGVDPEKVEPLIVVNKGVIANISVDKVQVSGVVLSRITFNLSSESAISVAATPGRTLLTVTFGTPVVAGNKPAPPSVPAATIEPPATIVPPPVVVRQDGNAASSPSKASVPAGEVPLPATKRMPKLEPVVPDMVASTRPIPVRIEKIIVGASYIEIHANQPITAYKSFAITGPHRLVIDIEAEKMQQQPKTFTINKFGISTARIGISPKNIRIVLDANKTGLPAYTITGSNDGVRVNFK